jgi:SAM-dependent methyltransferase
MNRHNDPDYLITDQYRDAANLDARIQIHRRFSANAYGWTRWLFDIISAAAGPDVLELGCGPAGLWAQNLSRVPADWRITLTDFSPGMVTEAQRTLGDAAGRFRFEVVDAQEIPFDDGTFNTVIANHMLYHVPDLDKALAEIHRVLRPGGRLFASTIGREHMHELDAWGRQFGLTALDGIGLNEMVAGRFGLETGEAKLARWFQPITLHRYDDSLRVTEAVPLMAYILSSIPASEAALAADKLAVYARFVENELAEKGSLHITKASGLFEAAPVEVPLAIRKESG